MLLRVGCGSGDYFVDNVEVVDYGFFFVICIILLSNYIF